MSDESVGALQEEFPELEELIVQLRSLGRSPVNIDALEKVESDVFLAREIGLLFVYEGTEDAPLRLKVPDIYLHGLGMTRKGQA
ncbi:MAG: hypothetical protein JRC92_08805 [Deltaproteobacteria bacterium]|nr:hypothetical protein [Deltaproteobacteria bacterium]